MYTKENSIALVLNEDVIQSLMVYLQKEDRIKVYRCSVTILITIGKMIQSTCSVVGKCVMLSSAVDSSH